MRYLLGTLFICAALCIAWPARAALPLPDLSHTLTTLKPAKAAKDFTLPDLDGKPHRLADYRGKVVLVNFWATWCPPCRREMPSMERLQQKFKGQAFVILAVNQQEDPDRVFVFTGQLEPSPTFPILMDRNSTVSNAWGVLGLPASFIVDQQGRVVYRAMGGRDFDHPAMEQTLRALLKK
jgi:thiol-disulfide isomerase/thioredoxin